MDGCTRTAAQAAPTPSHSDSFTITAAPTRSHADADEGGGEGSDEGERMVGHGVRPFFHYPHSAVSRDGHQGDPSTATAAAGKHYFELAVKSLADQVTSALTETPPSLV
jgi:creatinine amidohydrolase/Fe(II)-dependent formamide hydrolase-like protein